MGKYACSVREGVWGSMLAVRGSGYWGEHDIRQKDERQKDDRPKK